MKAAACAEAMDADKSLLTIGERVLGALVSLLALGVLLYTSWAIDGERARATFEADVADVGRSLDGALGELDTMMMSLVDRHHAGAGAGESTAPTELAARLLARTPAITSVGRYASIDAGERERFERELLDSGLYAFRITELDDGGHARPRRDAARHHPVSLLEPMRPERLRLVGADLGAVEGLGAALDRTAAADRSLISTLPAHWPAGDELLMFHAVYRGKRAPETLAGRLEQSDGGYWLAIDPAALLEGAGVTSARFALALGALAANGERRTLIERRGGTVPGTFLHALYPVSRTEYRRSIGGGELVLALERERGVPVASLAATGAIATLMLLGLAAAAGNVRRRRLAQRQRSRDLLVLHAERERADRTLNAIDDAVFTIDVRQRVLHLNPAAAHLVGHARRGVIGLALGETLALRHEDDGGALDLGRALAAFEQGGARGIDVCLHSTEASEHSEHPDPHHDVMRLSMSRTRDVHGTVSGYILVLRDISDERRLTRRLAHQANHDALTGCTNRRWFEARLARLLEDLMASGRRHALCYIDLDQFKIVNDTNGHAAGDHLLQELTGHLQALCRASDSLSRLGGDEFGLLLVDADEAEARRLAERVHEFFQSYAFRHGSDVFAVRASIGFVPLDEKSGTAGDVLAAADLACYAAKEGGRNGLYVYSPDDATMAQRSSELERLPELHRALAEDRFELHVQAVAELVAPAGGHAGTSGEVTHFEFLLRLTGEDGEPVTPFHIIEAAERYGLMREIDRWVIAHAVANVAAIEDGPGRSCSFSINLSGQSAADPTLIDFIEGEYARHDVDPARIWFELTETAAISQFSVAIELAARIRALGSKVALDDFGSGLSSFGYLKSIPVDVLKIDGQFVRNIVHSSIDRAMVRAIAEVGRSMGISTVAEFVEDEATAEQLAELGIDYAQGYHVGKPRPLREALAALSGHAPNAPPTPVRRAA